MGGCDYDDTHIFGILKRAFILFARSVEERQL